VVQLEAALVGSDLRDTQNFMGLSEEASTNRDPLDVTEAPPVGTHVRLSVLEGSARLAASYKPVSGEGQTWQLEVSVVVGHDVLRQRRRVQVRLVEHGTPPEGHALYLYDTTGHTVPTSDGMFEVAVVPGEIERLLVVVGTAAYAHAQREAVAEVPFADMLEQNYPNPFNPQTKIGYILGKRQRMELTVYDILGRRVRVLVRGEREAGQYVVSWDGRDEAGHAVASGVYFYRMEAGAYRSTRQMLLLR
jgi:hypothetical protein